MRSDRRVLLSSRNVHRARVVPENEQRSVRRSFMNQHVWRVHSMKKMRRVAVLSACPSVFSECTAWRVLHMKKMREIALLLFPRKPHMWRVMFLNMG